MQDGGLRIVLPGDGGRWRCFAEARRILTARDDGQVLQTLAAVDAELAAGAFVAGFLCYEAAAAFDAAHCVHRKMENGDGVLPLAWFAVFDRPPQPYLPPSFSARAPPYLFGKLNADICKDDYLAAVADIHRCIRAGEVYQVNFTYPLRARFAGDALSCFLSLAKQQPSAWNFFIETEKWAVSSLSPECFFARDGETITARPMKGTRPNRPGGALSLATSPKERAENLMIVDMIRNDLSRLPGATAVRCGPLLAVEEYPTVLQMTSTVVCTARARLGDIFAALFPCASITGAPKIAAMKQIRRLEKQPRGLYCGAIGWAGGEQARFNVAIRTAVVNKQNGELQYGVGGGVVSDSLGEAEWNETKIKAAILEKQPAAMLIETMRVERGKVFLLNRHLARLENSARVLGFDCDINAIRKKIIRRGGQKTFCLRLTMRQNGEVVLSQKPSPPALPATKSLRVCVAKTPVCSQDVLLRHKTNRRAVYDGALAAAKKNGFDDALFINEKGHLTETCIANVMVKINGEWLTPPLACGLLPGVLRADWLASGKIRERKLPLSVARGGGEMRRFNALRGDEKITVTF